MCIWARMEFIRITGIHLLKQYGGIIKFSNSVFRIVFLSKEMIYHCSEMQYIHYKYPTPYWRVSSTFFSFSSLHVYVFIIVVFHRIDVRKFEYFLKATSSPYHNISMLIIIILSVQFHAPFDIPCYIYTLCMRLRRASERVSRCTYYTILLPLNIFYGYYY